jgi:rhomboid-like protein
MNHAWTIAWRPARCFVQSSKTTYDLGRPKVFSLLARTQHGAFRRRDPFFPHGRRICQSAKQERSLGPCRLLSNTPAFRFQQASQQQIPPRAPFELAFRRKDLRPYEVKIVFGLSAPSTALGNTLLKVLHSRRVNGTLDLDLPPKLALQLSRYPNALNDALQWLRQEYPIDEDAAILRRIEREEAGEGNEELITRAENLGLYKPQSGAYGAKLGEDGNIMGESELQKLRRENELKADREQEELDKFIEQKRQAKDEKALSLEARREDGLEGKRRRYDFQAIG